MKNIFCLFLLFALFSCPNAEKTAAPGSSDADTLRLPTSVPPGENGDQPGSAAGKTVETKAVEDAGNDLNGDGETDRLDVVTTREDNDGLGFKRQLVVYSGAGADLDAWYTAEDVILSTEHGGMMGDPLESAKIENGTIVIRHFGGSRAKWHYTHRFRWQNGDFQLIGTTIINDDACTEYSQLDYNLSTNKVEYSTTPQDCSGDEVIKGEPVMLSFRNEMALPSMNGFKTGAYEMNAPEMKETVYF